MPTSARCSRQKFHEETPGQTEAVPEAGQPLIIGHFALQIVETVEKIQPEEARIWSWQALMRSSRS